MGVSITTVVFLCVFFPLRAWLICLLCVGGVMFLQYVHLGIYFKILMKEL